MNRGQEILVMTVNITENRKDQIIVHEYDDPEELAKNFIMSYNLNPKLVTLLTDEIINNLSDLATPSTSLPQEYHQSDSYDYFSKKNYGQKLYEKGLRKLEQNENQKQALKIRIEQEKDKELTFQPKINPVSNMLAQRMGNRSTDSIRKKESAIARVHVDRKAEELSACTFAPKINPNSAKMLEYKQRPGSKRFQDLYEDSIIRKQKQEFLQKQAEFSFKPEILSNHNVSSNGERLYSKKPLDELENSFDSELKDPNTGQELFVPKINKGKYSRTRELPIGEHLYSQRRDGTENGEVLNAGPSLEAKKRSEELLKRSKRNRYYEIFQQMNPDDQGLIHYETVDSRYIEPLVYKLMGQMLDVWSEEMEPLDFETFSESLDNLLKILSPDERNAFLIYKRNKEDSQQSSIKKSCSITDMDGVYSRQIEKKLSNQARLELEREKKQRSELDGCTFHPQTTPYRTFGRRQN
ncbi:hypothetical protein SteCoe_31756 [Stentor coeruleus]|uniref:PFU domain-containing protein n=1 Tax=Stentor coeruleus TaxID=5963 RepID=A0A1R2B0K1_9CILI|nr:hypothetical protein SteCoe_31756 [Stentor coeruleus]